MVQAKSSHGNGLHTLLQHPKMKSVKRSISYRYGETQQQSELVLPFDDLDFSLIKTGENLYSCPVCAMTFFDKRNFRHHYMVHSGEKPHGCPYCPYRARQKGTLKNHIISNHSSHTEMQYTKFSPG